MVAFFRFGSFFALAVLAATTQAQARYSLQALELGFQGADLNDAGQVSGNVTVNGVNKAALYSNGTYSTLHRSAAGSSYASAINARGEVLVHANDYIGGTRRWYGGAAEIFVSHHSGAFLTDAGRVVGRRYDQPGNAQLYYLNKDDSTTPVAGGIPDGADSGRITKISADEGAFAGTAKFSRPDFWVGSVTNDRAFVFKDGVATDIGTLGGWDSEATAVNDSGQVVGNSYYEHNFAQGSFIYQNGTIKDLGRLWWGDEADLFAPNAYDINNAGQVVGMSPVDIGERYYAGEAGFLYENGQMKNLNEMIDASGTGWSITRATKISDNGSILAYATNAQFGSRSVLLRPLVAPTPVPEPASMLSLSLGAAALHRRRRKG